MTDERESRHDEPVEDLEVGKEEAAEVKGGKKVRKQGGDTQDYYEVKLEDVIVS
jgi:hypothetical protein